MFSPHQLGDYSVRDFFYATEVKHWRLWYRLAQKASITILHLSKSFSSVGWRWGHWLALHLKLMDLFFRGEGERHKKHTYYWHVYFFNGLLLKFMLSQIYIYIIYKPNTMEHNRVITGAFWNDVSSSKLQLIAIKDLKVGPAFSWQENTTCHYVLEGFHDKDFMAYCKVISMMRLNTKYTSLLGRFLEGEQTSSFFSRVFLEHHAFQQGKKGHLTRSYSVNQHMGGKWYLRFPGKTCYPVKCQDPYNWWDGNPLINVEGLGDLAVGHVTI